MYKIPPSYYLKQAMKAEDYNTWVNMTFAFYRTSAVQAYFLIEKYKQAFGKLFQNVSKTAHGEL